MNLVFLPLRVVLRNGCFEMKASEGGEGIATAISRLLTATETHYRLWRCLLLVKPKLFHLLLSHLEASRWRLRSLPLLSNLSSSSLILGLRPLADFSFPLSPSLNLRSTMVQ